MKTKKFISIILNTEKRCDSIIKELENLDIKNNSSLLKDDISPYFINSLNTYVPFLLKEEKDSVVIAGLIYKELNEENK